MLRCLLHLLALAAAGGAQPPASALAWLREALAAPAGDGGIVLTAANASTWPAAAAEWNARVSAAPYAVVFVNGTRDAATALSWARAWELPLRARSGRHSVEGWSSCDGCLVLDVSRGALATVTVVDAAAGLVRAGAGASVGALLNASVAAGLLLPLGSCSSVGLAGFVLGGGIGWTSRLHGLAVDVVSTATLLLANGSVVEARPGDDLFWAARGGGGGNFALALSFDLAAVPLAPRLLYAEFAYPWSAAGAATTAYLALAGEPRFLFYCLFVRASTAAEPSALLQGIWLGDLAAGYAALAPLTALARAANASGGAVASIIETDYATAHTLFEGPLAARTANKQKSAFVPPTNAAALASPPALELVRTALVAAPADVADNSAVYLNMLGGRVAEVPPDATAFPHRGAALNWVIDAHWLRNDTAPAAMAWTRALYASMQAAGFLGAQRPLPTYVNYLDADIEDYPRAYFGDNYPRLQGIKRAVDPDGVFTFPQAVQPAPPPPLPPLQEHVA